MDLNSRRILDPADTERLALIGDTDEIADLIAELLGLVILRPDDYVPKKVVSYVYLWINFTRLRAGAVPFLYIGSRRKPKKRKYVNPTTDNYQGSNIDLNRDQAAGDDFQRYILETFEVDRGRDAFKLEKAILEGIGCRSSVEFYNWKDAAVGSDSETASAMNNAAWGDPVKRAKRIASIKKTANRPDVKAKCIATLNRPDVKAKRIAAVKKAAKRPDVVEKRIAQLEKINSDPEIRAKRNAALNRPDVKAKRIAAVKKAAKRPDVRAKNLAQLEKINSDPEIRAKKFAHIEKINSDPEIKEKHRKACIEAAKRPDVRAKNLAQLEKINSDPEIRAKRIAAIREAANRPDVKAKRIATLNRPDVRAKQAAAIRHPFHQAHFSYYDEFITCLETGDFEHCDGCGKVITVEPIREQGKITCFFCENPLQDA